MNYAGKTSVPGLAGVSGESLLYDGVTGLTYSDSHAGVSGVGDGDKAKGVFGQSAFGTGVFGESSNGRGVVGVGDKQSGVEGYSALGNGVFGIADIGAGVSGFSTNGIGVLGETKSPEFAAIAAFANHQEGKGAAVHAVNRGLGAGIFAKGRYNAAIFEGNVEIKGVLTVTVDIILPNADCAEDFDIAHHEHPIEAGTVMVLGDEGKLYQSAKAYDKCVAGVVSGAGTYKPGIVLDKKPSESNRQPIALLGKVYCKADAQFGGIEVGDMLTTSSTPGYAMKVSEPGKAFGAVIGKALRSLPSGKGLIPILISLQ